MGHTGTGPHGSSNDPNRYDVHPEYRRGLSHEAEEREEELATLRSRILELEAREGKIRSAYSEVRKHITFYCSNTVEAVEKLDSALSLPSSPGLLSEDYEDLKAKNEQQFQMLMSTTETLKLAYVRGHYCDQQPCPGCEAGRTLEVITGRTWTQAEAEESLLAELTKGQQP